MSDPLGWDSPPFVNRFLLVIVSQLPKSYSGRVHACLDFVPKTALGEAAPDLWADRLTLVSRSKTAKWGTRKRLRGAGYSVMSA